MNHISTVIFNHRNRPMALSMDHCPLEGPLFILTFIMMAGHITTTDFTSNLNPWSPVIKTKNATRDWKITAKSSPPSVGNQDSIAMASQHQDSVMSGSMQRAAPPFEILDHNPEHHLHDSLHSHQHYHHQDTYYDTHPQHKFTRYDATADADGYYYPTYAPGPPIYGPPTPIPTPYPQDSVHIELAFDRLVIKCVAHDPLEHIIWTRFPCPNDYFYGRGEPVAEGSVVHNKNLYDVRIVGENGDTSSELLMKSPLDPNSSGLYICDAWPHYKRPLDGYQPPYQPPLYPSLSDAFIIGGSELIDNCYFNQKQPFIHKPFPFKKRHDEIQHDHEDPENDAKKNVKQHKQLTKKQSNQSSSFVDVLRKPRNITRQSFADRKLSMFDNDLIGKDSITVENYYKNNYQNPVYLFGTEKEQKYNFKFENQTILNSSALDVFTTFSPLKVNDSWLFQNNSKARVFNSNRSINLTNSAPNNTTIKSKPNNFNFLINRIKQVGRNLDLKNNTTESSTEWHWTTNRNGEFNQKLLKNSSDNSNDTTQ